MNISNIAITIVCNAALLGPLSSTHRLHLCKDRPLLSSPISSNNSRPSITSP